MRAEALSANLYASTLGSPRLPLNQEATGWEIIRGKIMGRTTAFVTFECHLPGLCYPKEQFPAILGRQRQLFRLSRLDQFTL
jgi:hypothetical protein